ncbi:MULTISPECIES: DUF871 domain-containing protein [Exiguobacterium]|uniref:DUF871 domain-containing protein n=1 Tax=Exiguobacterium TaxID=33986 RepID=UPI001BE8E1E2|nr:MULTISPECIES: MupG family TIM beta-alpha barrel fold protein [Exiguobacterium]MCT4783157.1 MupG family TIM beta-alpha barrel fold protein [Exiguobacterium himgiriensis]
MRGLSVYLSQPLTATFEMWLAEMRRSGFTSLFTSLHIPEDDASVYTDRLRHLGQLAKTLDMELFADIAPTSLVALGKTWDDAHTLVDWGVTGLRVDYGVTPKQVADLSQRMTVALNASTLAEAELAEMMRHGLDVNRVEAWHNFYPRPETGLERSWFEAKNVWLKRQGIRVQAFIPGDGTLRGPLFERLPTLEEHRAVSSFACFLDLERDVDRILIGDPAVSDATREQFMAYDDGIVLLRAEKVQVLEPMLYDVHTNRMDPARDVVRSVESRAYGRLGHRLIEPIDAAPRPFGTITIDNTNYGRYAGEMQVTRRDLDADDRVNVIGRVVAEDRPLIRFIGPGTRFRLSWD